MVVPDGFKAPTGPAAFAQFAIDPHARTDEEGNGRGDPGQQDDETEALAAGFAEVVGDEQSRSNADRHFRRRSDRGGGQILRKSIKGVRHGRESINQPEAPGNRKRRAPRGFFRPGIAIAPATL